MKIKDFIHKKVTIKRIADILEKVGAGGMIIGLFQGYIGITFFSLLILLISLLFANLGEKL